MPFAFTVFDDTDNGTVDNLAPVYALLHECGMRTTKSVWPLSQPGSASSPGPISDAAKTRDSGTGGATLEDPEYLAFIRKLQAQGFEIALHGVSGDSSERERIELGLTHYRELLGTDPAIHCNHDHNRDNLYWGVDRAGNPLVRALYTLATRGRMRGWFSGHVAGSPYFWGDLCRSRIKYVRNFVFDEINLNRINPSLPYRDPRTPYVNYWFSSTDGGDVTRFCRALSEENQDRLEAEQGVCVMYTHFASGFVENGKVNTRCEALLRRLAAKGGTFVPVGVLLDRLLLQRGGAIPAAELRRMEWRWLREKLRKGTT